MPEGEEEGTEEGVEDGMPGGEEEGVEKGVEDGMPEGVEEGVEDIGGAGGDAGGAGGHPHVRLQYIRHSVSLTKLLARGTRLTRSHTAHCALYGEK